MRPPPPPHPDRGRRGERPGSSCDRSEGSAGGAVAAVGIGLALVAGAIALFGWASSSSSDSAEREREANKAERASGMHGYYCLPHDSRRLVAAMDAVSGEDEDASRTGNRCVCCHDRGQRFMFVQCHHLCLCEPCLMHMAHDYEDTRRRRRFDGPVEMACPVCRTVGRIIEIYSS